MLGFSIDFYQFISDLVITDGQKHLSTHPYAAASPECIAASTVQAMAAQRWPLARRKLHDECMSSFLIGNTHARPLPQTNGGRRVLYACSGDCRNALATAEAWGGGEVEITLNDANPCVATRNVILLRLLRKGETEAARQLWGDARLDGKSAALVTRELQAIALGVNDDAGVRVRKGSRAEIQRCAAAWLAAPGCESVRARPRRRLGRRRRRRRPRREQSISGLVRLRRRGARRQEAAQGWSCERDAARRSGGRRVVGLPRDAGPRARLCARCAGLAIESEEFLSVCVDEWAKLGAAAARASFVISCVDALRRPPAFRRRGYDCVDASNTPDYAGLWNVLLALAPTVAPGGRLLTEHALTRCGSLDALLRGVAL